MSKGTDGADAPACGAPTASIDCINCNGVGYVYDACDGQRSTCLICGGSGDLHELKLGAADVQHKDTNNDK